MFRLICAVMCLALAAISASAAEYYVAPNGTPRGTGTNDSPWDLASTLAGQRPVKPGDIVWLRGGVYANFAGDDQKLQPFVVKLAGTPEKPIIVRACKGERATIDGGLNVVAPANYLWLWDLEVAPAPDREVIRETKVAGSHPADLGPGGGVTISSGKGCKYINLVVQNNSGGGFGFWTPAQDSEIYGCIVVNNGWKGPDRNHGHCIYTQNKDGTKTIANCILTTRWGDGQYTMHAYGSSRADCDNFVIEDNIAYAKGPFLVGSGKPSHNIIVRRNYLYKVPMQIGYGAANEDCEIRGNVFFGGGLSIRKYKKAVVEDNLFVGASPNYQQVEELQEKNNSVLKTPPAEPKVVLLPNKYDSDRAHLAIFNWSRAEVVLVKVAPFLKPGEAFRLMHPEDFYGKPVLTGRCQGDTITLPMKDEFAVFVLLRGV